MTVIESFEFSIFHGLIVILYGKREDKLLFEIHMTKTNVLIWVYRHVESKLQIYFYIGLSLFFQKKFYQFLSKLTRVSLVFRGTPNRDGG